MISPPTRKAWPALLALVALILVGAGCKDFFKDPQLTSIAISPAAPTVAIGSATTLSAKGTYDDNSTKDISSSVTWLSNNTAVATVTSKGVVTGVTNGSTTIQATAANGVTASVTIAVGNAVVLQTISVTPLTASVATSGTQQYMTCGHILLGSACGDRGGERGHADCLQDDSISHRNCDRRRNAIGGGSLDGGRSVRYASYNALRGNGSNRSVIGEPSHRGCDVFRAVVVVCSLSRQGSRAADRHGRSCR